MQKDAKIKKTLDIDKEKDSDKEQKEEEEDKQKDNPKDNVMTPKNQKKRKIWI